MKKLQEIDRLVEEAYGKLCIITNPDQKEYVTLILTDLAKKCAEINSDDIVIGCNGNVKAYNSLLREGQVNLEPKQEEKPALKPLPEEMPEWFNTFCGANQKYNELRQHFGTQPREWWMDLKKGDKFINHMGQVVDFLAFALSYSDGTNQNDPSAVQLCRPYTPPSPIDQLLSTFTPEQKALWDAIKDGKDE